MIKGKYLSYNDDLTQVHSIRNEVFTKELGIPEEIEKDDNDMMAIHAELDYEGQKIATGRMRYDGETFILDKVCVLPEFRRKKYADFVVRMLLDKVFLAEGKIIYAEVFTEAVPFFETIGFVANGEEYKENSRTLLPMKVEHGKVKTLCGGHH